MRKYPVGFLSNMQSSHLLQRCVVVYLKSVRGMSRTALQIFDKMTNKINCKGCLHYDPTALIKFISSMHIFIKFLCAIFGGNKMSVYSQNSQKELKTCLEFRGIWPVKISEFEDSDFDLPLISPTYSAVHNYVTYKWQLVLYPKGLKERTKSTMGLFLKYLDGPLETLPCAKFGFFFLNSKDMCVRKRTWTHSFDLTGDNNQLGDRDFLPQTFKVVGEHHEILVDEEILRFGFLICIEKQFFERDVFKVPSTLQTDSRLAYLFEKVVLDPEGGSFRSDFRCFIRVYYIQTCHFRALWLL